MAFKCIGNTSILNLWKESVDLKVVNLKLMLKYPTASLMLLLCFRSLKQAQTLRVIGESATFNCRLNYVQRSVYYVLVIKTKHVRGGK